MVHILIVEDERPISELIRMNLEDAGYQCTCAYDGVMALRCLEAGQFDLALLDVMLPKIDGFSLMEEFRSAGTPVIFLTAKTSVADKVRGLHMGAEDYITKPFELAELLARVETVLRRYNKAQGLLTLDDVALDPLARTVTRGGVPVKLTAKEYELALMFLQNRNIALFRDRIYERIWGDYYDGDSRTVDLHIQRMRRKLGWEKRLVTVPKVGYRLEDKK